ncbi:MAG: glutathione synthase [Ruminococcus sp.]
MGFNFCNTKLNKNMFSATFGLEKESLRIDEKGFLSHTKHPFAGNPKIERDFCENQVEMVTDVFDSTEELIQSLTKLHNGVVTDLLSLKTGKELLWGFSNPPYVKGSGDIPIAEFDGSLKGKKIYREYLAKKYGKKKMLFSGIHLNYSFGDELLNAGFQGSNFSSFEEYKNSLYLELAKKITKYSWLIVYLTGASPVADGSFLDDNRIKTDVITPYSSARCSEIGYWNDFVPVLDYTTVECYTKSIQSYVDRGMLKSVSELYYPIRLKPRGANSLENLNKNGVNHIELRMLDLNPLSPVGIFKEDIDFIHLLIIYLMSKDDRDFTSEEQITAVKNIKNGAKFDHENTLVDFGGKSLSVKSTALNILNSMEDFFISNNKGEVLDTIEYQKRKITEENKRYAQIIIKDFGKDFVKKGVQLSEKYADAIQREG